jgi:hypothetical protein
VFPLHAGAFDRNVLQSMLNVQCLDVRHIYMAAVGLVAGFGQLHKYHSGCITSEDLHMHRLTKDTDSVCMRYVISQMCCREDKHCKPFRLADNASFKLLLRYCM